MIHYNLSHNVSLFFLLDSRKSTSELCQLPFREKLNICNESWYQYKKVNPSMLYASLETNGMICEKVPVKLNSMQWVTTEVFECEVRKLRIFQEESRPTDNFFITTGCDENTVFLLQTGTLEDAHPSFVDIGIENYLQIFAYVYVEYPQ